MASTTFDMRGLTIGLEHDEVEKLTSLPEIAGGLGSVASASKAIAALFAVLGLTGAWIPYVAVALALHLIWEVAAIKASDKGNGVWLNAPPPILIGMPGVVIPSTKTLPGTFDGMKNDGTMGSSHNDEIRWEVGRSTGTPGEIKFTLVNETDWSKAFKLRIPASYWVEAAAHQSAENGCYENELAATSIEFHKPQMLGFWGPAGLSIADWNGIKGGDIVTFRWVKD